MTAALVTSLAPQAIASGGGAAYLNALVPSKEELDRLVEGAVHDGRGLMEIFSQPPTDPHNVSSVISRHLNTLEEGKKKVDAMWKEARHPIVSERSDPIGQSPTHSSQGETAPPGGDKRHLILNGGLAEATRIRPAKPLAQEVGVAKPPSKINRAVSQRHSDKYNQLEEEAYEVRGVWSWAWSPPQMGGA